MNHYWFRIKGSHKLRIGEKGIAFRQAVSAILNHDNKNVPTKNRVALYVEAHPPDRRRRDLDNILKALMDSLQYANVYQDDTQVDIIHVTRGKVVPGGKVNIHMIELPKE